MSESKIQVKTQLVFFLGLWSHRGTGVDWRDRKLIMDSRQRSDWEKVFLIHVGLDELDKVVLYHHYVTSS